MGKKNVAGKSGSSLKNMAVGNSLVNSGVLSSYLLKSMGLKDAFLEEAAEKGRKYYTVQFNPSTLTLSGHAGGFVQRLSYDAEDKDHNGIEDPSARVDKQPTTIIMSVSLLFDACDPQNAFLDDKLTLNPTSVGTGIAKGIMQATGNKSTSVQTQVEGFIAALRNGRTRIMTFCWGNFCYSGVLRSVGAGRR